ncbi:MAG: type II secretion system protein [Dethiobacter sp.]|jgi:prepilin-type N-terminal cleavage/methylation domain-containing protein|nr:type II secretion system protein [Dethiobacter sp.]
MKLLKSAEKKRRSRRGFTLIEMLVVIALISALATIAVPTIFGVVNASRVNGPCQPADT